MSTSTEFCKNCQNPLAVDAVYCTHCGQKNTDGKITVRNLFAEFFDAVFNIESRTLRTLSALFTPGKLTREYFAGRHKKYVHPLRTLLVMSVLFILVLNILDFDKITNQSFIIRDEMMIRNERELVIDSLVMAQEQTSALFENDTVDQALDSLHYFLRQRIGWHGDSFNLSSYLSLFDEDGKEMISRADFLRLSPAALTDKYEKKGWFQRKVFKQTAKYIHDESVLSSFLVSSMSWIALLIMPVIALLIQLFYRRQKRYYVEHLIFSFHLHSFFFLIISVALWVSARLGVDLMLPVLLILAVYFILALKRVYQEKWGRTIGKSFFIFVFYFAFLVVTIVVVVLAGFMII